MENITKCKCITCGYCKKIFKEKNYNVYCTENSGKINKYFNEHKIAKMPGFIGYTKRDVFPIKRTPKWCPLINKES